MSAVRTRTLGDLELEMRAREVFHGLRFQPGAWVVLRLDGHGFSRFTENRFMKPFDERFHSYMAKTAAMVFQAFQAVYAFTESDEISILLPPEHALYSREVEKHVSLSAGLASAHFSRMVLETAIFDSRVWQGTSTEEVLRYFQWRQADATRCALNGWCYWTLRQKDKLSAAEATEKLHGATVPEKNELLFQRGINFNEVPAWQRRGTGVWYREFYRAGYNPKSKETVKTVRRAVHIEEAMPYGCEYASLLTCLCNDRVEPPTNPVPE